MTWTDVLKAPGAERDGQRRNKMRCETMQKADKKWQNVHFECIRKLQKGMGWIELRAKDETQMKSQFKSEIIPLLSRSPTTTTPNAIHRNRENGTRNVDNG